MDISTAQRWMKKLDYHWAYDPKDQYVDGHEQEDVVDYRQNVFLPRWANIKACTQDWSNCQPDPLPHKRKVVVWFHNELTFYANDRRVARWVHSNEAAKPYAKGEGASHMVADLVSANYGWLRSPDGEEEARVLFKAGKNCEGYFTAKNILNQAAMAIDILKKHYPDEDHVLVYDNATTHQKQADGALSACYMPLNTSKLDSNWLVEINALDGNGKQIYTPDRQPLKTKVQMEDTTFPDGTKQSLYFPLGHLKEGLFKGMQVILEEQGITLDSKKKQECPSFKCPDKSQMDYCYRRVLFNQLDFAMVESLLETYCKSCGVEADSNPFANRKLGKSNYYNIHCLI
jgi:hypothetical protein